MRSQRFTKEQVDKLIENTINYGIQINIYKLRAVIYYMMFTGARKRQVLQFQRNSIDFENKSAIIHSTKKYDNFIYRLPKQFLEIIQQYFGTEPPGGNGFCMTSRQYQSLFRILRKHQPANKFFTSKTLQLIWRKNVRTIIRFKRKKVREVQ